MIWHWFKPKTTKCAYCGAYNGHAVNCPDIDLNEAKEQLNRYHYLWLTKEMWARKRSEMWHKEAERWRGKYLEVKHENNQLRKKLKL